MTPEKAQELLEAATPGPWERHPDKPRALCNLERKFAVHMELVKDRGLEPDPEDVANTELIAAAPELAETVAGLRFMYGVAVEMPHGTGYLAEDMDGDIWVHSDPHFPAVMWFEWDRDAEDVAYFWNKDHPEHATARVVRHLVGDPEVAE